MCPADAFEAIPPNHAWVAKLGGYGYNFRLRFNRVIDWVRARMGKEPFSLAKWAKAKVKSKVSPIGRWEEQVVELARWRQCTGLICWHIPTPTDQMLGDHHSLNPGHRVESRNHPLLQRHGLLVVIYPTPLLPSNGSLQMEAPQEVPFVENLVEP